MTLNLTRRPPANRISGTHSWQSEKQPRPEHAADYISLQTEEEEESRKQHWCDLLRESCIQPAERTTRAADTLTCRQRKSKHQTELCEIRVESGRRQWVISQKFHNHHDQSTENRCVNRHTSRRLPQQFVINIRHTAPASEPSTSRAAQDVLVPVTRTIRVAQKGVAKIHEVEAASTSTPLNLRQLSSSAPASNLFSVNASQSRAAGTTSA